MLSTRSERLTTLRLPELDDMFFAHDGHLAPALFVVRRARVGHREIVVGRHHAAHLVQWLGAGLPGEHLVLDRVPADSFIARQTPRPHDSTASRPTSVLRPTVPGRAHPPSLPT